MSRFKYTLFIEEEYIADYTSVNEFLKANFYKLYDGDIKETKTVVEFFKLPLFTKRVA